MLNVDNIQHFNPNTFPEGILIPTLLECGIVKFLVADYIGWTNEREKSETYIVWKHSNLQDFVFSIIQNLNLQHQSSMDYIMC